jgi:hypothetical protein
MNKNKKLIFIFLAVIIIFIVVVLFIKSRGEKQIELSYNPDSKKTPESFIEKTTFLERESAIKTLLAGKYKVGGEVEVFIARETDRHINGLFFIENYNNEDVFRGVFFVTIDSSAEIVWSGQGDIDCPLIKSKGFPAEMAPECF